MGKEKKVGRNTLCPCGSGQKYKYCCIGSEIKKRLLPIYDNAGRKVSVDMTDDFLNVIALAHRPLMNFCKDHGFYLFEMAITIGECQDLTEKLKDGLLNKSDLMDVYRKNCTKEFAFRILEFACEELSIFKERQPILFDCFEAHFHKKYTLSIPAMLPQLEGLLRELGSLSSRESIRPTIPKDIWEKRLLFSAHDSASYFNGFIHNLYKGSATPLEFNRNPILHGFRVDYHSEEHSLMILLAILEIRHFQWLEQNTPDFTKRFQVNLSKKEDK